MNLNCETMDDPTPSPPCPASVRLLFGDYGTYLGIPDLVLDAENRMVLDVNGTRMELDYLGEGSGLLVTSILSTLEEDPDLGFWVMLNMSNQLSQHSGLGIVTIDPDTGDVVWSDRFLMEGVTVEMLDEAIKRSAVSAAHWKEVIQQIVEPESDDTSFEPETGISEAFIKV